MSEAILAYIAEQERKQRQQRRATAAASGGQQQQQQQQRQATAAASGGQQQQQQRVAPRRDRDAQQTASSDFEYDFHIRGFRIDVDMAPVLTTIALMAATWELLTQDVRPRLFGRQHAARRMIVRQLKDAEQDVSETAVASLYNDYSFFLEMVMADVRAFLHARRRFVELHDTADSSEAHILAFKKQDAEATQKIFAAEKDYMATARRVMKAVMSLMDASKHASLTLFARVAPTALMTVAWNPPHSVTKEITRLAGDRLITPDLSETAKVHCPPSQHNICQGSALLIEPKELDAPIATLRQAMRDFDEYSMSFNWIRYCAAWSRAVFHEDAAKDMLDDLDVNLDMVSDLRETVIQMHDTLVLVRNELRVTGDPWLEVEVRKHGYMKLWEQICDYSRTTERLPPSPAIEKYAAVATTLDEKALTHLHHLAGGVFFDAQQAARISRGQEQATAESAKHQETLPQRKAQLLDLITLVAQHVELIAREIPEKPWVKMDAETGPVAADEGPSQAETEEGENGDETEEEGEDN